MQNIVSLFPDRVFDESVSQGSDDTTMNGQFPCLIVEQNTEKLPSVHPQSVVSKSPQNFQGIGKFLFDYICHDLAIGLSRNYC